jgi:hypothetical protein
MDIADVGYLGDALHWLHATQVQVDRFGAGLADSSARRSARIREDDWRATSHVADAHFLLVSTHNLAKALNRLPPELEIPRLSNDVSEATALLRNILEHWEEQRVSFASLKGPPCCQKHGTTSCPCRPAGVMIPVGCRGVKFGGGDGSGWVVRLGL